jgi:uncharacterized protein YgiM (DUF1202 family)
MVFALPTNASAAVSAGVVATRNTGRLNLRAAPSSDSVSLALYYNGTAFDIIEYTSAEWVCVRIGSLNGGQMGYFSRNFIQETTAPWNYPNMKPTYQATFARAQSVYGYPKQGANVLATLPAYGSHTIEVLGSTEDNEWHHVIYHGAAGDVTGFMQGDIANSTPPIAKTYTINAPGPSYTLNLRRSMSTLGGAIGAWYNGTQVTVLDETSEWAHVRIGDPGAATISGYMMKTYLTENRNNVYDRRPTRYLKQDGRSVKIYYEPSTAAVSDKTYPPYSVVPFTVLGESNGWLQVIDQQTLFVGWILKSSFN